MILIWLWSCKWYVFSFWNFYMYFGLPMMYQTYNVETGHNFFWAEVNDQKLVKFKFSLGSIYRRNAWVGLIKWPHNVVMKYTKYWCNCSHWVVGRGANLVLISDARDGQVSLKLHVKCIKNVHFDISWIS